jgi:hypothetical protein
MRHLKTTMVALVTLAGAFLVLLSSGTANASDSSCNKSTVNVIMIPVETTQCIFITGSGLHVTSIRGTLADDGMIRLGAAHIEIKFPSGQAAHNCSAVSLGGGATTSCTWSPNAHEPAGNYCVVGWTQTGLGNFVNLGESCAPVHT